MDADRDLQDDRSLGDAALRLRGPESRQSRSLGDAAFHLRGPESRQSRSLGHAALRLRGPESRQSRSLGDAAFHLRWAWTVMALVVGFATVSVWLMSINVAKYHVEQDVVMSAPARAVFDGWPTGLGMSLAANALTLVAIWLAGRRGPALAAVIMAAHVCACAGVFLILASGVVPGGGSH